MTDTITISRPDDWHCHLRDGEAMACVVGATARQFARAIVMPNLKPPGVDVAQGGGAGPGGRSAGAMVSRTRKPRVVDVRQAGESRERILAPLPRGAAFEPLM